MINEGAYLYSHTVGFHANAGRGFKHPADAALAPDGVLYVVNRGDANEDRKRVTVCTLDEEYLGEFSTGGSGDGQIEWPVSVAIDKDENIYISDEGLHRISIFNKQWQFIGKWGVKGRGQGEFDRPAGIAFDREDNLLVVDSLNNRVQRYTRDGVFLGAWGGEGVGRGEFNRPWGITTDQAGNVYVADWRNDRIQKFDSDGRYLAGFGTSGDGDGQFNRPAGVAVGHGGEIYVADWGNERVQVLGPEGDFRFTIRGEAGLSKWAMDYFISNQDELREREAANLEPELGPISARSPAEQSANIEKLLWGPTSVKIDPRGRICIVDSCRHRIQIYLKES